MYITVVIRPDLSFLTNKLVQFLTNPSLEHYIAADQVIEYLYYTRFLAIELERENTTLESDFIYISDVVYADDPETRYSSASYIFYLFNGPIDWRVIKQKTVSTFNTEVELLALSNAARELY